MSGSGRAGGRRRGSRGTCGSRGAADGECDAADRECGASDGGSPGRAQTLRPCSAGALAPRLGPRSSLALLDIRSRAAYRRAHLAGSVSIPAAVLSRRLFLLPPRERELVVISRDGPHAASAARELAARGWARVSWLAGSLAAFPRRQLRRGPEPNRLWEPAALLRESLRHLPRDGRALDLACGSGREAAWLALRGRRLLGVDVLPDALRQARRLAREAGVPPGRLSFRRADLSDPTAAARILRPRRFRIILCFRYLDRALFPLIAAALAPGGVVVYQTFLQAQARAGRPPRRAAFLLRPGELRQAFAGLRVLRYEEGPDERGDHLASLVARAGGS